MARKVSSPKKITVRKNRSKPAPPIVAKIIRHRVDVLPDKGINSGGTSLNNYSLDYMKLK